MLEDRPLAELRCERGVRGLERILKCAPAPMRRTDMLDHAFQERTGLLDSRLALSPAKSNGSATTDQLVCLERLDPVERARRPIHVERISGLERRLCLDQITHEQRARLLVEHRDVTRRMPAPTELQVYLTAIAPEVDRHVIVKG